MPVYDIAVMCGSLPFIFILGWRPQQFGLNRLVAIGVGLTICLDAMLFPWVLHYGRLGPWLAVSALFIVLVSQLPEISKRWRIASLKSVPAKTQTTTENLDSAPTSVGHKETSMDTLNELNGVEPIVLVQEQRGQINRKDHVEGTGELNLAVQTSVPEMDAGNSCFAELEAAVADEGDITPQTVVTVNDIYEAPVPAQTDTPAIYLPEAGLSLEDLLDLGFAAKTKGDFAAAANWFVKSLALDPSPDIAFYLLTDIYWLCVTCGQTQFALEQLQQFSSHYYRNFDSQLRRQFVDWLSRENIDKDGLFN